MIDKPAKCEKKPIIAPLLQTGKGTAITGRELAQLLGLTARDITAAVERERKDGSPICASTDADAPGYYLPADREELNSYICALAHRVLEMRKTLDALNESYKKIYELPPIEADADEVPVKKNRTKQPSQEANQAAALR